MFTTFMEQLRANKINASTKNIDANNENSLRIMCEWWESLSIEDKNRPHYTMAFFRHHIDASPAKIGSCLHQMGFKKTRLWRVSGPNSRVWLKPG